MIAAIASDAFVLITFSVMEALRTLPLGASAKRRKGRNKWKNHQAKTEDCTFCVSPVRDLSRRKKVNNLVFYALSTGAVIAGPAKEE